MDQSEDPNVEEIYDSAELERYRESVITGWQSARRRRKASTYGHRTDYTDLDARHAHRISLIERQRWCIKHDVQHPMNIEDALLYRLSLP